MEAGSTNPPGHWPIHRPTFPSPIYILQNPNPTIPPPPTAAAQQLALPEPARRSPELGVLEPVRVVVELPRLDDVAVLVPVRAGAREHDERREGDGEDERGPVPAALDPRQRRKRCEVQRRRGAAAEAEAPSPDVVRAGEDSVDAEKPTYICSRKTPDRSTRKEMSGAAGLPAVPFAIETFSTPAAPS